MRHYVAKFEPDLIPIRSKGLPAMTTKTKKQSPARGKRTPEPAKRKVPVIGLVFAGVALALVAAIVFSSSLVNRQFPGSRCPRWNRAPPSCPTTRPSDW